MKKYLIQSAILMASAMALASVADAGEQGFYTGVNAGVYQMGVTSPGAQDTTIGGAGVTGGYDLGEIVAFELRVATTFNEKDVLASPALTTTLGLDYAFSYLVKPYYDFEDAFAGADISVYALAGGTTSRIKAAGTGFTNIVNKTSFSYGIGVESPVTDKFKIGLEWFRPMTDVALDNFGTKLTVDAFQIAGTYKF